MGEENIIHENTLYAEPIAHVGSFPITNALATSTVALLIIAILAIIIRRNLKKVPTGLQNAMEIIIEGFLGIFDGVTGDRKKSLRFAPVVLAFFFFILINNWMGPVSYTHLRAHETDSYLVCRLLLEKKKTN